MANLQNSNGINNGMLCNSGVQHGYPAAISAATSHNPAPLYALNPTVHALIQDVVSTFDFNADYLLAGLLTTTSALIGNKINANAGNTYFAPSNLFALIIGNTGVGKSPAFDYFQTPVKHRDRAVARKTDAEHDGQALKKYPTVCTRNATFEALILKLKNNPAANVLLTYHEINDALSVKHNNSANLRDALVVMWDGDDYEVNRATTDDTYIERPRINVMGAIQPQYIKGFIKGAKGFGERFLFFYPENPKKPLLRRQDTERVCAINKQTKDLILAVANLATESKAWELTPDAFDLFAAWANSYNHAEVLSNDQLSGITSKITGNALRLALTIQVLNVVTGHGISGIIGVDAVQSAIVVAEYCLRGALKAIDYTHNPSGSLRGDNALVYGLAPNETPFKAKDLYAGFRDAKGITDPTKYDSAAAQVRRACGGCVTAGAFVFNEQTGKYTKI